MKFLITFIRHWWIENVVTKGYLRACAAEQQAIFRKERDLGVLRDYISRTGKSNCGCLVSYEKLNPPYLKMVNEDDMVKFMEAMRQYSLYQYFHFRYNVIEMKEALALGKDKELMRLVKKFNVSIEQESKVHFKRG